MLKAPSLYSYIYGEDRGGRTDKRAHRRFSVESGSAPLGVPLYMIYNSSRISVHAYIATYNGYMHISQAFRKESSVFKFLPSQTNNLLK